MTRIVQCIITYFLTAMSHDVLRIHFPEIVLSMPLEEFSFAVDKEILWRNNGIATPATKGREYDTPHLPLRVK